MKIYIGGISPEVTEKDLMELFSQFGKVDKVDLLKDPATGENRGYAFVLYTTEDAAESAVLGANNTLFGNSKISVSMSRSRLDQKRARQTTNKTRKPFENTGSPRRQFVAGDRSVNSNTNNPNNARPQRSRFVPKIPFVRQARPDFIQDQPEPGNHVEPENYAPGNYSAPRNNFTPRRKFAGRNNNGLRRDQNQMNLQRGVDYGRPQSSTTQSFLGREGFANNPRTMNLGPDTNNSYEQQYAYQPKKRFNKKKSFNPPIYPVNGESL